MRNRQPIGSPESDAFLSLSCPAGVGMRCTACGTDNADVSPEYLARVRSPASGYLSTPFAEDIELSMRM